METFYFTRKSTLSKYATANQTKFDPLHILDWQMEAISNLHLSKDAFYTCVCMSREIFNTISLNFLSEKMINLHAAAIVSLTAKFMNASMNYTQVVSGMCSITKSQLVDLELIVSKKLKFRYPVISVESEIIGVCEGWHSFLGESRERIKIDCSVMEMGVSSNMKNWSIFVQNKMEDVFYFFDAIMLKCPDLFEVRNAQDVKKAASFALFAVMNYLIQGFFPLTASDRPYLLLIFHSFLANSLHHSPLQNAQWSSLLVSVRKRTKMVEMVDHYFQSKYNHQHLKEDIGSEGQSTQFPEAMMVQKPRPFLEQAYYGSRKWK